MNVHNYHGCSGAGWRFSDRIGAGWRCSHMMEATDECAQLPWLHRGIVEDALIWLHFLKISMPFRKDCLLKPDIFL